MSSKPARGPEIFDSLEAAFIKHYDWLIRWGLQFTNNDRARAEDLVQEVFAQFAFAHTDLSRVQDIPSYLYVTLRNTHVSAIRLAGRSHTHPQSIVEYSVADKAVGASDPYSLYQTQDELRRVCQYACVRKQSSRAGSVLILRYFLGYHLSEVGAVLGGSSQAVRQCLRFARNEARLFLDTPGALKFIDRNQTVDLDFPQTVCAAGELPAKLRVAIFRSCQGECLASTSLRDLYAKGHIVKADNLTLAHIVSCPRCLDTANRALGLPLLAQRHPADALGPNNNWRGDQGGGQSGGGGPVGNGIRLVRRVRAKEKKSGTAFLLQCQRRARELFEHYPTELLVSANGHILGSQSVTSETSRLRLDITITEPLSFVEVMSQENARLLVMTVEPPPNGEPTQARRVELSEGRDLEATLRYGHPWPMLEVVYHDPAFAAAAQPSTTDIEKLWEVTTAPLAATEVGGPRESCQSTSKVQSSVKRQRTTLFNFLHYIKLLNNPLWYRPGFITAVISVLLIGAILFLRLNFTPSVTATNLLEQAGAAETATEGTELAIHRVINLEERLHHTQDVISRSRIEIWRDKQRDLTVRRMYDSKGELVAAELAQHHSGTGGNPSRLIYRPGREPQSESSGRNLQQAIENLELWQLEPSAIDYGELIGRSTAARVSEASNVYVISYEAPQGAGATVLQATLTLRKSDLHALEQSLLVQRAGETHDFLFVEASFARPPLREVAPGTFELYPELSKRVAGEVVTVRRADTISKSSSDTRSASAASPELEVQVAFLLDQFRMRFGDQVNLIRTADGALEVNAIVDTENTRQEILRALAEVANHPALRIRISTASEAYERQQRQRSDRVIVREFTGSDEAIPTYADLHRYFSEQERAGEAAKGGTSSSPDRVDQAVRSFASRAVGHSRRALSHAMELQQLSSRFSVAELEALSPSARSRWFSLVRNHAEALRRELSLLSGELQPVFFAQSGRTEIAAAEISNNADLLMAIERLAKLMLANDDAIRSAFTASTDNSAREVVKSSRFRVALVTSERSAAAIQEFAGRDD